MRTYFDFSFPTLGEGCTMYSAELILYQTQVVNTTSANVSLRLYDLAECAEWSYTGITWNNQPVSNVRNGHLGLPYIASRALSSSNTATYYFDITDVAENYYYSDASDNGYMLALSDESKPVMANFGGNSATNGTAPQLRVYYTRPCLGCGDKCAFDTSSGQSCTCGCQSWEVCNCWECGYYCGCGKLNCAYGVDCECGCLNADECECVACKGFTTTTEDENGNVISHSVTNGTKTMTETYTYTNNSLTSMVDVNGNTTSYGYDANGRISSLTNGNSTVSYAYNGENLSSVSQDVSGLSNGTGITNTYVYNEEDKVTSIAHNDFSYNFAYNANGNNTAVSVGEQSLATYGYDTDGDLQSIQYGNGFTASYFYDTDGNLVRIHYTNSDGSISMDAFEYSYDEEGNLCTVTDYCSETYTVYDDESYTVYKLNTNEELYYENFEEEENCLSQYGPVGCVDIEYLDSEFDFITGITTYTENVYTDFNNLVCSSVYDYFGRKTGSFIESEDCSSGDIITLEEEIGYNDTDSSAGTLPIAYSNVFTAEDGTEESISFRYTYDNKGNITAIYDTSSEPEALIARYAYDEANQLIREDNAKMNKSVVYVYDKGGNLVEKTEYPFSTDTLSIATSTAAYTYDGVWKDKLVGVNGTEITYDAVGNPLTYGDKTFTWAGRDLWSVSDDESNLLASFCYDQNGLRTKKTVADGNYIHNFYYYWTNDNNLLGYSIDLGESEETDLQIFILYDENNEAIGFTISEYTFYYVKNIQGDVVRVVDSTGEAIADYTYDAWGNFTCTPAEEDYDCFKYPFVASFNPVTYRGYLFDYELGLYYLKSRYYDPKMGRFINADDIFAPFDTPLYTNIFTYCCNSPVFHIDPTGYAAEVIVPILGVPISFGAILATALSLLYLVDSNVRKATNKAVVLLFIQAPGAIINAIKRVAQSVRDARKKTKTNKTNNHHIVAKNAAAANKSRVILNKHHIDINHKANLVKINKNFHQHLHTNLYHDGVYAVLEKGDKMKKAGVFAALLLLNGILKTTNSIFF